MKKALLIFIVIQMFVLTQKSFAWFDEGHMIIASIAWDDLSPEEQQKANYLISLLADADPDYSDFIRAATWMDGIKGRGLHYFDGYHFINQYYVVYSPDTMPLYENGNVVWTIEQAIATFKGYKPSEFAMGMSFRFLIHAVGDIHQPLHNTSRVSKETPKGDRGGNSFPVDGGPYGTYHGKISYLTNLHKLWDSGVLSFAPVNAGDPDFDNEKSEIEKDEKEIIDYYNSLSETEKNIIDTKIDSITDPREWSRESFSLGIEYAYHGISENAKPSEEYIRLGQKVCMEQAYIAGKRLSKILKDILKKVEMPS
jgi:hypothetical protein